MRFMRLNERKHKYMSYDAWTTLIYQIIKIFYLQRVKLDSFNGVPQIPINKIKIPDHYNNPNSSNIFT